MLTRLYRSCRFGRPVVVVSGLPRAGTSMMMRMLEAGGLVILTDRIRAADEDNPRGYFEFEPVKQLDSGGDLAWLREARGKAIKIISALLTHLPETYNYRLLFMHRDMAEILASQEAMLLRRGEVSDGADLGRLFTAHLDQVKRLLAKRPCFEVLEVAYGDVLDDPHGQARRINRFLGGRLDPVRMAGAVDPALYRNRRVPS